MVVPTEKLEPSTNNPIKARFFANGVIVDVAEAQFTYPNTIQMKQKAQELILAGHPKLVINLTHVDFMDSFGIAAIISVYKLAKEKGGNLTLFGLNTAVNQLFEITKMDKVLDIWPTEGQALAHLSD